MPRVPTLGIFLYSTSMSRAFIHELSSCSGVVLYTPCHDEVDPLLFSPIALVKNIVVIPRDIHADVATWARTCVTTLKRQKNVCVAVPGTAFDMYGTRHGHGGGWYDRFLSYLPKEWTRIGVATPQTFTINKTLTRQSWDEPVDYVLVYDASASSWIVHEASLRRPCTRM